MLFYHPPHAQSQVYSTQGRDHVYPYDDHFDSIRFNAAINVWFAPVFKKEIPCRSCRKQFNYDEYFYKMKEWLADSIIG